MEVPDQIVNYSEMMQLLLWIGGVILTPMCAALVVLWRAKESSDKYAREQDKSNQALLINIANNYQLMGKVLEKLEKQTSETLSPSVLEIRRVVNELVKIESKK